MCWIRLTAAFSSIDDFASIFVAGPDLPAAHPHYESFPWPPAILTTCASQASPGRNGGPFRPNRPWALSPITVVAGFLATTDSGPGRTAGNANAIVHGNDLRAARTADRLFADRCGHLRLRRCGRR